MLIIIPPLILADLGTNETANEIRFFFFLMPEC